MELSSGFSFLTICYKKLTLTKVLQSSDLRHDELSLLLKILLTSRVDHHKRNLPTIKRHIWILWKLARHTTIIKIFEFGWETVQRATCSSKTTFLSIKFKNSVLYFYGTVLTIKRHKKILWTVSWFQISHKKFCIIKFPIFWGYLPNKIKRPVSDSLNVKKQKIHFYGTVLTIKRHKKNFYEPFYGFKFSIKNSVLQNSQFFEVNFQKKSKDQSQIH